MQATGVNYEVQWDNSAPASAQPLPPGPPPQQDGTLAQKIRTLHHPVASIFHLVWKVGALLTYLFGTLFISQWVVIFIVCITFLAFDFWTVKNVSGRLMVGLRWWNEIKEDGSNEWIFESKEDKSTINSFEKVIFWGALFIAMAIWAVFAIVNIMKPQWLVITVVGIVLTFANILGYIKCARESRKQIKSMATNYLAGQMVNQALNRV